MTKMAAALGDFVFHAVCFPLSPTNVIQMMTIG